MVLVRPDVGHAQQVLGQSRVRETCIAGCVSTHTLGVMAGYSDAVARPSAPAHTATPAWFLVDLKEVGRPHGL